MDFDKYDLIITNKAQKVKYLKMASSFKKILNVKILTLNEFKDLFLGKVNPIYYKDIIKHFNLSISSLDSIVKYAYFNPDVWDYLTSNNYILSNKKFMLKIKNILVVDVLLDKYILELLKDYNICFYKDNSLVKNNKIYEFELLDDEISFVATKIINLLKKGVSSNSIKLVNVSNEMITPLKRIFALYGLNVFINQKRSIYSSLEIQRFFKDFYKLDLNLNVDKIKNVEIKTKLINIINKYNLSVGTIDFELLKYELKKTYYGCNKKKGSIELIEIEDVVMDDSTYFVMGFNEGVIPRIIKDEDYLNDLEKEQLNINTSYQINKYNNDLVLNKILHVNNMIISYHLKSFFDEFIPSHLVLDSKLEVIKNYKIDNCFSKKINVLKYGMMMDDLRKYNLRSSLLSDYYTTYKGELYNSYDNKFTGIKQNSLYEYLNNELLLSYSSLDNYFHCGFKYYIKNILGLEPYEETLAILIGNLFHLCLSKMYEKDFDLDAEYQKYLSDKNLGGEDKFFALKLKEDLKKIIEVIKKQESHSKLKDTLTEKKIYVDISDKIKVTFMGIVDKIKYDKDLNIMAIIDYKTGNIQTSLDNINYGFHLQLPVYIYLVNNEFKKSKIVGFYLQKILNSTSLDEDETSIFSKLKLDGYTLNDESIVELFDDTYLNSENIKSLRMSKTGWYKTAKVLSEDDINSISLLTKNLIESAKKSILAADFSINPKRIDNVLEGCKYCKFNDICYIKEKDIVDLKGKTQENILGGDIDA